MAKILKLFGMLLGFSALYCGIISFAGSGVKKTGNGIKIRKNFYPVSKVIYGYNEKTDDQNPKEYLILLKGIRPFSISGLILWDHDKDGHVDGCYKKTIVFGKTVEEAAKDLKPEDLTTPEMKNLSERANEVWKEYREKLKVEEKLQKYLGK